MWEGDKLFKLATAYLRFGRKGDAKHSLLRPPSVMGHFFALWVPWQEPAMAQWAQLQPQEDFPFFLSRIS